jgi:phosphocarrier protein HPr
MSFVAEGSAQLTNEVGLHARPAVKLMQLAKSLPSAVELSVDGRPDWIDAKSIVKVMKLKASKGEVLKFRVTGGSAESDLAELIDLVTRDFDE